ncbi:hypothetical protein Dret_0684 [Desulfohalobium retbaense DSM 5692]|uniref:Uncharacterized protein n=1 Tax=Desulfohalobium retbaense (strain ATCC 49708 / DSM 5692 / JCM 16813 / HR100) TaxID=485915 RepID=C8X0M9_DESRD|nr:hypothetical protein Dret_0684 [Desulfohalobium retbaense DSM 5692]
MHRRPKSRPGLYQTGPAQTVFAVGVYKNTPVMQATFAFREFPCSAKLSELHTKRSGMRDRLASFVAAEARDVARQSKGDANQYPLEAKPLISATDGDPNRIDTIPAARVFCTDIPFLSKRNDAFLKFVDAFCKTGQNSPLSIFQWRATPYPAARSKISRARRHNVQGRRWIGIQCGTTYSEELLSNPFRARLLRS